uniref:Uncharacterized protein n=1 Tax=Trichogramma kaykai TaxID=54128 RepID=A0ABD2WB68_9HYME
MNNRVDAPVEMGFLSTAWRTTVPPRLIHDRINRLFSARARGKLRAEPKRTDDECATAASTLPRAYRYRIPLLLYSAVPIYCYGGIIGHATRLQNCFSPSS